MEKTTSMSKFMKICDVAQWTAHFSLVMIEEEATKNMAFDSGREAGYIMYYIYKHHLEEDVRKHLNNCRIYNIRENSKYKRLKSQFFYEILDYIQERKMLVYPEVEKEMLYYYLLSCYPKKFDEMYKKLKEMKKPKENFDNK